jgi:serine/threonine-protein kinase
MEDAAPTAARLRPATQGSAGAPASASTPERSPEPQDAGGAPARPPRPVAGADRRPGDVVLGRYALLRILGRGGAGTVWMAEDQNLGRVVAIKCLPTEGGTRALNEARAAARLGHPTVVGTYGLGTAEDCTWLVTEFVAGDTLRRTIKDDTHTDDELLQIGIALCVALRHAHDHGIVHRDVTPRNVLVPADAFARGEAGADGRVVSACHPHVPPAKLADFGIARPKELHEETRKGRIVGTLSYMAPERLTGGPGDEAGDLWALGVVLHEAFVGEHPAGSQERAGALVRAHAELPSLGPRRADLPACVVAAIDRAVDEEPAARGTVLELERALRDGLAERGVAVAPVLREGSTRESGAVAPARPPVRTPLLRAAPVAAAAGALLAPVVALAVVLATIAAAGTALIGAGQDERGRIASRRLAAGLLLLALAVAAGGLVVSPLVGAVAGPVAGVLAPVLAGALAVAAGGCPGLARAPRSIR